MSEGGGGPGEVPGPPVEAVIALSIVFVAAEVIHEQQGRASLTARAPWIVAATGYQIALLLLGGGWASLPGRRICRKQPRMILRWTPLEERDWGSEPA